MRVYRGYIRVYRGYMRVYRGYMRVYSGYLRIMKKELEAAIWDEGVLKALCKEF